MVRSSLSVLLLSLGACAFGGRPLPTPLPPSDGPLPARETLIEIGRRQAYDPNPGASDRAEIKDGIQVTIEPQDGAYRNTRARLAKGAIVAQFHNHSQRPVPEYALEQWLRCDALWPALFTDEQAHLVQQSLDEAQVQPDDVLRIAALKRLFTRLMHDAILTPLFNYQYQVSAPPGVNGIRLNARGWFDFSEAWLPPDTR